MRLVVVAASLLGLLTMNSGDIDPSVRGVVVRDLRFSSRELSDLQNGKVVRHLIETGSAGEIALAGAIRIRARKEQFLNQVRDIVNFKRGPDVLQIGRFSDPPTLQDLASLTVDKNDFDARTCRIGSCGVRLPSDTIQRFQNDIHGSASDIQKRTEAMFKQVLLDHVIAYQKGEARGRITEYDDDPKPIRPGAEFEGLLHDSTALNAIVPGLVDHFRHYPAAPLGNAEDFLYWSKERFGIAPFITVTHVTIACPSAHTCIVATRDVYSSRYIDASLALSIATDALSTQDAFYLVYANWSRASALKGVLAGVRRTLAEYRGRNTVEQNLRNIKARLEKRA